MEINPSKSNFIAYKNHGKKPVYTRVLHQTLKVSNGELSPLKTESFYKYLGVKFENGNKKHAKTNLMNTVDTNIDIIDKMNITGPQKIWLYNVFFVSKMSWQLMVTQFSKTFISDLQRKC